MKKEYEYFIVDNEKIAELMEAILEVRAYRFYNAKKNKDVYSFLRTDNIGHVYMKAKSIIGKI